MDNSWTFSMNSPFRIIYRWRFSIYNHRWCSKLKDPFIIFVPAAFDYQRVRHNSTAFTCVWALGASKFRFFVSTWSVLVTHKSGWYKPVISSKKNIVKLGGINPPEPGEKSEPKPQLSTLASLRLKRPSDHVSALGTFRHLITLITFHLRKITRTSQWDVDICCFCAPPPIEQRGVLKRNGRIPFCQAIQPPFTVRNPQ